MLEEENIQVILSHKHLMLNKMQGQMISNSFTHVTSQQGIYKFAKVFKSSYIK